MVIQNDPIVEQCNGCDRTIVGPEPGPARCKSYAMPSVHWRNGKTCQLATHIKKEVVKADEFKLNPLKASKRSMGK